MSLASPRHEPGTTAGVAFAAGAAISLLAIAVIALGAYFAGSAPRIPISAAFLENLTVRGARIAVQTTQPAGPARPANPRR